MRRKRRHKEFLDLLLKVIALQTINPKLTFEDAVMINSSVKNTTNIIEFPVNKMEQRT